MNFIFARNLVLALFVAAGVSMPCAAADTAPEKLARDAIGTIKLTPQWDKIYIDEAKENDYRLVLVYKAIPTPEDAEIDTKQIARVPTKTIGANRSRSNERSNYSYGVRKVIFGRDD